MKPACRRSLAPACAYREREGTMFIVDIHGMLVDSRIISARRTAIEHADMTRVSGIVVHQTGAATAQSTLESYKRAGAHGAHFLLDKDGACYQTASLHKQTWHVGKLRSRCLLEQRCTASEQRALAKFDPLAEHRHEARKAHPLRFPSNQDSIGIELVGELRVEEDIYETVTPQQNRTLGWLVAGLTALLKVPLREVFRHPEISRKHPTEASTARW
jgi:N-acetyl-anhydromuramyl-L-alanine amidase AmpD